MLKDYIDCENDATSEFLTDMPGRTIRNMMSEEITPEPPEVQRVVNTITLDDVYEIECSSVAEEIIIEDVKVFDSSSPNSEDIEIIGDDSIEELQSPISDEVDELIQNEHINSKNVLTNNEFDTFLDKILPNNEPVSTNELMEIDTPFLNGNSSQSTNDVEIVSEEPAINDHLYQSNPTESATESSISHNKTTTSEVADKPYKCHICGKLFSRNSSLKCHIRLHVEGPDSLLRGSSEPLESFKSHYAELSTKKEEVVELPTEEDTTGAVLYDESATGVLNSSNELADEDDNKRDYKCIICEKTFSRKSSLSFHYKFHPKSSPPKNQDDIAASAETIDDETTMEVDQPAAKEQYKCDKCDRSFAQRNTYAWHLKMHETNVRRKSSDSNTLIANETNGIIATDVVATNDVNVANPEMSNEIDLNLYKCHLCPRSFPQLRGLKTHSGVHRKKSINVQTKGPETLSQIVYEEVSSRKYVCGQKRHNHDGEVTKLYKCNVCCKCFCDIGNLKRHLARNHQEEDTSEASDNDHIVESRKKSVGTVNDSKTSRKQGNTRVDDDLPDLKAPITMRGLYKCGVCDETFDEIRFLSDHVNVHIQAHNDSVLSNAEDSATEELNCVVCEKTFRNQNALSRHMNEHRRREEEIFVRVTSSGRKIRERRSSEDLTTSSPIKCIPCNRSFESIRAKHIHDASKHPVEQPEPNEPEADNDNDTGDDEEYVCECCNRQWANLRALSMHKSWNRHRASLAAVETPTPEPIPIDDDDQDPLAPDDITSPEENKTENDVSSSVKCGCCNELFPNIPSLNAHLSGQTNSTIADGTVAPDYEKKDMLNCDSLRDLVKCDRCDKFCSSIPALKLHIISDHTKKSVPQSSAESSNSPAPKLHNIPDNAKKSVPQSSTESSSIPVPKSRAISDNRRKSTSQSSVESLTTSAAKSRIVSDRRRKSLSQSSAESSSIPVPKSRIISDQKKRSLSQSSTESSSTAVPKSRIISNHAKTSTPRNSTEGSSIPAQKSKIISDRAKKSISQSSAESSSTPAPKSKIIYDRARKSVSQSVAESSSTPASKSHTVSDGKVDSIPQNSIEKSSTLVSKLPVICDHSKQSVPQSLTNDSSTPATQSPVIFEVSETSAPQGLTEDSKLPIISDDPENSVPQGIIEDSKLSIISDDSETSVPKSSIEDTKSPIISNNSETPIPRSSTEQQPIVTATIGDNFVSTESQNEPQNDVPIEPVIDPLSDIANQSNDTIVDKAKPPVNISHAIRRRKSIVANILDQQIALLQCDLCDETFTSNRALNSHKSTHTIDLSTDEPNKKPDDSETPSFACCDKTFATSKALKLHQRHHPPITQVSSAIGPIPTQPSKQHSRRSAAKSDNTETNKDSATDANSSASHLTTDTESDDGVFRDYKCSICDKRYSQKKYLRYHRAKHFEPGEIDPEEQLLNFLCPKCPKRFEKETSLRVHKAYHTTMEMKAPVDCGIYLDMRNGIYKCKDCDREFESIKGVGKHYAFAHKEHVDGEPYQCPKCDRSFTCSQGLAGHSSIHRRDCATVEHPTSADEREEEPEDFSCPQCDKSFSNATSLRKHGNSVHGKQPVVIEPEPEPDLYCALCKKSFVSRSNLKRHRRNVHRIFPAAGDTEDEGQTEDETDEQDETDGDKLYNCSHCKRKFTTYRGLNGHKQMHQLYTCYDCKRTFTKMRSYNIHMETCTGEPSSESEENVVESESESESQAENKCDESESQEEYKCDQCDRSFPSARSLGGHKPVHYGKTDDEDESDDEPEYKADSDGDADNEGDDQPNEFQCRRCDRSFASCRSLSVHMNSHNAQDNPLELACPQCERVFISYRALGAHFLTHRSDENRTEFPCPKCNQSFLTVRELYDHFSNAHKKAIRSRRSVRGDSKAASTNDLEIRTRSKDRQPEPATVAETSIDPETYPCTKCGQKFASNYALSGHRRKCKSRSKSVEVPASTRGDNSTTTVAIVESVNDAAITSNSGVRKSRRLKSFFEGSSSQQQDYEQMDVDNHDEDATMDNMQLSCVFNDHTNLANDTAPKPKCDICSLTFDDLKSLAKHLADTHESTTNSIDKRYEFNDLQIRVHHCTQCDKIFANRVGLRRHSLTHSEPLPLPWEPPSLNLPCPSCHKLFPTAIGLKRHSAVHRNTPKPVESEAIPLPYSVPEVQAETTQQSNVDQSVCEAECLTNGVDESIKDTNLKPSDESINAANPEDVDELIVSSIPNGVDESIKATIPNGVDELVKNTIPNDINESIEVTPQPTTQIPVRSQDNTIDRVDKSLKDTTISSTDTASDDQLTGDDDPDTTTPSVPIISCEPISCLSCKICSRQFSHVKAFNKHVQWHKFNDDAVDGEDTSVNDDSKQRRSSNGTSVNGTIGLELLAFVRCDICAETFKKAETLKKHAFDVHSVTITSPILYQCGSCDKAFPRGKSLFMHLKSHTTKSIPDESVMPFECASCEKCFRLKDDLLEHVKTHLNGAETVPATESQLNGSIDPQPATLNGNTSNDSTNGENFELKINSDHSDDEQKNGNVEIAEDVNEPTHRRGSKALYECSDCDKKFVKKCYLSTHVRMHKKKEDIIEPTARRSAKIVSPQKQYKCPLCEGSFRLKTSLAVHVQKHSSDKLLRKSLKRPNDDPYCYTAEDGVRSSKRTPKDIS